jgi:hypothetical protein
VLGELAVQSLDDAALADELQARHGPPLPVPGPGPDPALRDDGGVVGQDDRIERRLGEVRGGDTGAVLRVEEQQVMRRVVPDDQRESLPVGVDGDVDHAGQVGHARADSGGSCRDPHHAAVGHRRDGLSVRADGDLVDRTVERRQELRVLVEAPPPHVAVGCAGYDDPGVRLGTGVGPRAGIVVRYRRGRQRHDVAAQVHAAPQRPGGLDAAQQRGERLGVGMQAVALGGQQHCPFGVGVRDGEGGGGQEPRVGRACPRAGPAALDQRDDGEDDRGDEQSGQGDQHGPGDPASTPLAPHVLADELVLLDGAQRRGEGREALAHQGVAGVEPVEPRDVAQVDPSRLRPQPGDQRGRERVGPVHGPVPGPADVAAAGQPDQQPVGAVPVEPSVHLVGHLR